MKPFGFNLVLAVAWIPSSDAGQREHLDPLVIRHDHSPRPTQSLS